MDAASNGIKLSSSLSRRHSDHKRSFTLRSAEAGEEPELDFWGSSRKRRTAEVRLDVDHY